MNGKAMNNLKQNLLRPLTTLTLILFATSIEVSAQQTRIIRPVDITQRFTLPDHIHPRARAEFDQGRVSPSFVLTHITIALAPSAAQKADLDQLLKAQQDPASAQYHHWLTPEEYAQHFGGSDADLAQITGWLQSQGLTVTGVARARNWISVDGTAAQVERAFQTEIHNYVENGATHFANSTSLSLPVALQGIIGGIHGLNDFRMKPAKRAPHDQANLTLQTPSYTSSRGNHYLAPDDLATIYNINPLYGAGWDGSGQKLVVAGQTQINLSDIEQFRSSFNLPANDPQVVLVPNTKDPGISSDDLPEADLDLEWSGGVARNASIVYVYSTDVMDAVQYAIDQNLAPVISTSYGLCEAETLVSDALLFQTWARQGNAQGMTWFGASGDSGGADCDDSAHAGLSVDVPAAIPEVTGVGGTEFSEGTGQFWNATNDSNQASVLSYIPETSWNDSATDGTPSASGGGASMYFSKPSWQTGAGVPSDNARHVPDVALNASADHDGYLVYTGGKLEVYGGTSVPTPTFAGLAALLNQFLVASGSQSTAGLANINPKFYSLAQNASGVFHDITTGNNIVTVTCSSRVRTCTSGPVGYSAGAGYDQVTGLGSVDVSALFSAWSGKSITPIRQTTMTLVASPQNITADGILYLTATVTGASGATPAGTVTFMEGQVTLGTVALVGSGGTATATLSVSGSQLAQGSAIVTAEYSGDVSTTASVAVTVSPSASSQMPTIASLVNGASFKPGYAPGMVLTVFGSQLAASPQNASTVPLPASMSGVAATVNGISAPLFYASPGQLNIQLPFEVPANSTAVLAINNNGQTASQTFPVAAAAPGIFTDQNGAPVPNTSGSRGQIITLYVTGAGALSPAVSTGDAPASGTPVANLPKPIQAVSITVGGLPANIDFYGVPSGLVGVVQINYQIPAGAGLGAQPVVVTVGGVPSASALLTVTN